MIATEEASKKKKKTSRGAAWALPLDDDFEMGYGIMTYACTRTTCMYIKTCKCTPVSDIFFLFYKVIKSISINFIFFNKIDKSLNSPPTIFQGCGSFTQILNYFFIIFFFLFCFLFFCPQTLFASYFVSSSSSSVGVLVLMFIIYYYRDTYQVDLLLCFHRA